METPTADLSHFVDSQYNLVSTLCPYCEESRPAGQTRGSAWFNALWHFQIDCKKRQDTPSYIHSMKNDYELAGRDPAHTFRDIRSANRARRRQRTEREKYFNYRDVKRGQLGLECVEQDPNSPLHQLNDLHQYARLTTMTKPKLYREARLRSNRPRHHRCCYWCQVWPEKAKRNTDVKVIKRSELDAAIYDDGHDAICDPVDRYFCCERCDEVEDADVLYDGNGMVGLMTLAELDELRQLKELMGADDDSDESEAEVDDDIVLVDFDEGMDLGSDDDFVLVSENEESDLEGIDHYASSDGEERAYEESRDARP